MFHFILYYLLAIIIFVSCEEKEISNNVVDKCNFNDSEQQPYTFSLLSRTIPPTLEGNKKGDSGKIGVIGGSIEYTGAPYFSAITALKTGADLVYIITTEEAAPAIKSYSPDLIVYPYLNTKYAPKIRTLLAKMNVIIIGPGLGREDQTIRLVNNIIEDCRNLSKPLVIDADGLYAITKNSSILKDYPCPGVILTPNFRELNLIMQSISHTNSSNWYNYWGNCVSVLVKGSKDYFYSNTSAFNWVATGGGSGRRVSGQGDVLSGALGTFYNWAIKAELCKEVNHDQLAQSVASYAAAKLTRLCNYKAFTLHGRNLIASDMIKQVHPAFELMFSLAH